MSRRIHDLTPATLHALPLPCRGCVFWEVGNAPRGVPLAGLQAGQQGKEAWWQVTQLEWGLPGKGCFVDDELVGFAVFGPASHFPRVRQLGHVVSEDALLLATLWVKPQHRGGGVAKLLLQSVLREAHRRGARAIEAYGEHGSGRDGRCVLPAAFLEAAGFRLLHEDIKHPLFRLDLRQTARESVGQALENVLSVLSRRERSPAPAPARPALEARPARPS